MFGAGLSQDLINHFSISKSRSWTERESLSLEGAASPFVFFFFLHCTHMSTLLVVCEKWSFDFNLGFLVCRSFVVASL
jgi:hypothetical protein